jgi:hypothetical protein
MSTVVARESILKAYRDLYRAGLRTVRYSNPARFQLRDILRDAFRTSSPAEFIPHRIRNTILFLENASNYNGFEHRIVKNLLKLQYWKKRRLDKRLKASIAGSNSPAAIESRKQIRHQTKASLIMLNESLGTCLSV